MEEKKKGCAIFLSSHNLSEVEKYCDRVAIIKGGNLLEVSEVSKFKNDKELNVRYTKNGKEITMKWFKDVPSLLSELNRIQPDTLEITKPSIEEEFMKYYEAK